MAEGRTGILKGDWRDAREKESDEETNQTRLDHSRGRSDDGFLGDCDHGVLAAKRTCSQRGPSPKARLRDEAVCWRRNRCEEEFVMKQEAQAIDTWALIAVVILGIIFGTCALSAFGLKTASAQTPGSWSQFQDPFEHA